jgi:hypothetical protein
MPDVDALVAKLVENVAGAKPWCAARRSIRDGVRRAVGGSRDQRDCVVDV